MVPPCDNDDHYRESRVEIGFIIGDATVGKENTARTISVSTNVIIMASCIRRRVTKMACIKRSRKDNCLRLRRDINNNKLES